MVVKATEDVPRFVLLTEGTKSDKEIFKSVNLPKDSIVVLDKGYNSYSQFDKWGRESVSWVTRMVETAAAEVQQVRAVSDHQQKLGVCGDEIVVLGRKSNHNTLKITARRTLYRDPESGRTFSFITNNTTYAAATIAAIYKRRWQIELLFKRLKQNYPLRDFLGDNENAIKIQIWCSLITDLLLKIIKSKTTRKWSYSNIAGMVRLHLMTYLKLTAFLNNPEEALLNYREQTNYQLTLFKT
jgi:IS4 transposase